MGKNEFICRKFLSTPPASTMKRNGDYNIILNILFQQIFFSLSLTTPSPTKKKQKTLLSIEDGRKKWGRGGGGGGSHETNGFKNWILGEPQSVWVVYWQLHTRRLPGKALQPGKVTWFLVETLANSALLCIRSLHWENTRQF